MKRADLQQLAEDRAIDAKELVGAQRWTAAYYIAGYAVECALKACVLSHVEQNADVIFRDKRFSEKCWTHNIEGLVALAGLNSDRDRDAGSSPQLDLHWQTVKGWIPESRYQQITENDARELVTAINDARDGVLQWIRGHW